MKKLFTLFLVATALLSQNASAQIQKGEKMLGGNISIGNNTAKLDGLNSNSKAFFVGVAPQLGFGVGNNWIVGINAGYSYSKQKSETGLDESTSKGNSYTVGV
ncbi:MAG TPA: autotransporter outer membrane beta-barrel domain-containing protein, partial [Chitinophagaceae bacterium]|nr:autotransporter outer membrane beta-barrel domain-containing protein [Chitinophagaceae bacterium]